MKTYVITLSKIFPKGHIRVGDDTYFHKKLIKGINKEQIPDTLFWKYLTPKIHTIRANYHFWEKRIAEVERGDACLSIRQWSGKAYRSKQVEIVNLTNEDCVGIQKLEFVDGKIGLPRIGIEYQKKQELAKNDGLSFDDWESWFKGYDLTQPMAIIHFTKFRY